MMGGIAFGMGHMAADMPDGVDAVFSLSRNTFRGATSLQMDVKALQPVQKSRMDALTHPDPSKDQTAVLNALLDAFSQPAGKTDADAESITNMDWNALKRALHSRERGHLLISRSSASALRAPEMAEMDVCRHTPEDPRGFATLLTAPLLSFISGHWTHVWLLDGELLPQEAERWINRLPGTQVHILPRTPQLCDTAAAIDAGDAAYRVLYKALRTGVHRTLHALAESVSLTETQSRAGLHAFRQLGLIELSESPFRYTLLAAQKCVLGDSPVLSALRGLTINRKE